MSDSAVYQHAHIPVPAPESGQQLPGQRPFFVRPTASVAKTEKHLPSKHRMVQLQRLDASIMRTLGPDESAIADSPNHQLSATHNGAPPTTMADNHASSLSISLTAPHIQRVCGVDESCAEPEIESPWDDTSSTSSFSGSGVNASGAITGKYAWGQDSTFAIDDETQMSHSSGYHSSVSFNPNDGKVEATAGYSQTNKLGDATCILRSAVQSGMTR